MKFINLLLVITIAVTSCSKLLDPDEPGNLVPKTVAEDLLLPYIEINGTKLHAETFGDIKNPIIVFLNGGPGVDYRCFISEYGIENASRYPDKRTISNGGLNKLQDQYFCIFFDQRGAGLSPRFNPAKISFDILVEDLDAIIRLYIQRKQEQTGITDTTVILFGHSFGGVLATGYANKYPHKVKDIITYEPGPFTKDALKQLDMTIVFAMFGEKYLDEWLSSLDHITADDHARADYQQALGASRFKPEFHENENIPFWRIGAFMYEDIDDVGSVIERNKLVNNLSAFDGRFLFMYGEFEDKEFPDYDIIQMSYFKQASKVMISQTGHSGVWERSSAIVSEIRKFLQ